MHPAHHFSRNLADEGQVAPQLVPVEWLPWVWSINLYRSKHDCFRSGATLVLICFLSCSGFKKRPSSRILCKIRPFTWKVLLPKLLVFIKLRVSRTLRNPTAPCFCDVIVIFSWARSRISCTQNLWHVKCARALNRKPWNTQQFFFSIWAVRWPEKKQKHNFCEAWAVSPPCLFKLELMRIQPILMT